MFGDNPLLTLLGRSGRGTVVDHLLAGDGPWTVRAMARSSGVSPMNVSRAFSELAALGVIEWIRPGRDGVATLQENAVVAALRSFQPPDFLAEATQTFANHYDGPGTIVRYRRPTDAARDPLCPARIAVLARDEAWDALDSALDAVREAGWPTPDVIVIEKRELEEGEEEGDVDAIAILQGEIIQPKRS